MAMAATDEPGVVGPVPFRDRAGAMPPVEDSGLPDESCLAHYKGTWVMKGLLPGFISINQGSFRPHRGDVILTSQPKSGITWLKAMAFAIMARGTYPPGHNDHPLLRLNPHDCVPFMEMLFAAGQGSKMDMLPSPRLMATHMHYSILPASISNKPDCKIVYICREPKDTLVSLWHFVRRVQADLSFSTLFEAFCEGTYPGGPIWDHVLGYWNASKTSPKTVLFLKYDEMLHDPVGNTMKLAQFVGQPFSPAEEEAGVVMDVVRLCSFDKIKNLEINKAIVGLGYPFTNDSFFRKGEAGDWKNHMTLDMAQRLDVIVEEKLRGSGLSFA